MSVLDVLRAHPDITRVAIAVIVTVVVFLCALTYKHPGSDR